MTFLSGSCLTGILCLSWSHGLRARGLGQRLGTHQTTTPRSTLHPTVPRFLPADGQGKRTLTTRQRPHNSRAGSDKTKRHDKTEVISGGKNHQQQSPTGRQHQSKPGRHTTGHTTGHQASTATCANTTPNITRRNRQVTGTSRVLKLHPCTVQADNSYLTHPTPKR